MSKLQYSDRLLGGDPLTAGNDHRIAGLKDIASELAEVHQSAR